MKRFLMLAALGLVGLCSTTAHSQSRDLGAERLILDDGGTGRLTIEYAGPNSGTLILPDGGGSMNPIGTVANSTLRWDGGAWVENTNFQVNAAGSVIGDLRISPVGSTTADPAILGITPWSAGNAARWEFGDAANAISSSFGGRMQMVSWWGLDIYGAAGFGAPIPSFPAGTAGDDAVTIHTVKTGTKGLAINGITGQTADLQEWKVGGVEVARVTAAGALDAMSLTLDNALTIAEGGTGIDATGTAANLVFASPNGAPGAPSFRALVGADVPAGSGSYIANGTTPQGASFNITGSATIGDGADNISLNAGTGTFSLASSAVDISTLGAVSGVTTFSAIADLNSSLVLTTGEVVVKGRDVVGSELPFIVEGNIAGLIYGSATGETLGRLQRLRKAPSGNFYDMGIDNSDNFFITARNSEAHAIRISPVGEISAQLGTFSAPTAAFSGLKVAAGADKYAGIITTDDASVDSIETFSNSLITTSSIIVLTLNSELGATQIVNAVPGAGSVTVKFTANVVDGSKLSYIIVNP